MYNKYICSGKAISDKPFDCFVYTVDSMLMRPYYSMHFVFCVSKEEH